MAKQHKAPTQISIAPLKEKSGLQESAERYWKPVALIGIAIAAWIVFSEFQSDKERIEADESWNTLAAQVDINSLVQLDVNSLGMDEGLPEPSVLGPLADALQPTSTGPWARLLEARSLQEAGALAESKAVLEDVVADYPQHALVTSEYRTNEDEELAPSPIPTRMLAAAEGQSAWRAKRVALEGPPELSTDSPQVRITTQRGDILIGLYSDRAPQHVENFLRLCGEGYYDGTRIYRVVKDQLIQAGDPNTRDLEKQDTWGQGGPDYTIPAEITDAWHFRGTLSAARKPGEQQGSGSQFYIAAKDLHQYDKQDTVFGRVLDGMELVDELAGEVGDQGDRPENPLVMDRVVVVRGS